MTSTREERIARIAAAVAAHDPSQHERLRLPWRSGSQLFPVIDIELDTLILNPRSHRIRAQLESHERREVVERDPWSDEAQTVIAEILRDMPGSNYDDLVTNLEEEGQQQPGVITAAGLLVNANRRAVAMRNSGQTHIRVAVLPADAQDHEIDGLELGLQMQRDFREDYTFTNRLLFVDELIGTQGRTINEVARALNVAVASNPKALAKGRSKVQQDTRVLAMIRAIQERSDRRIVLMSFDEQEIAFEELDSRLQELGERSAAGRGLYEVRLLGLLTDVPYRDLRELDADAVEDHILPMMLDNDELAKLIETLPTSVGEQSDGAEVTGLDLLEDEPTGVDLSTAGGRVVSLNDLLARSHGDEIMVVEGDDGPDRLDRERVVAAIRSALRAAAQVIHDESRRGDRLKAPTNRLAEADRKVQLAQEAYEAVADNGAFDLAGFRAAIDRLGRRVEELAEAAGDTPAA